MVSNTTQIWTGDWIVEQPCEATHGARVERCAARIDGVDYIAMVASRDGKVRWIWLTADGRAVNGYTRGEARTIESAKVQLVDVRGRLG